MNAPTVEQLLLLVGSAEKRQLTPTEAALLRVGIDLLADRTRELHNPARPHPTAEEATA